MASRALKGFRQRHQDTIIAYLEDIHVDSLPQNVYDDLKQYASRYFDVNNRPVYLIKKEYAYEVWHQDVHDVISFKAVKDLPSLSRWLQEASHLLSLGVQPRSDHHIELDPCPSPHEHFLD